MQDTKSVKKSNRLYKNSVFVDLFSQDTTAKSNFISLYNALHDTNYTTENAQIHNITLENVLYMNFSNDISFTVNDKIIVLIEHQSTINENMPLRCLEYIGRTYEKILSVKDRYARALKKIPSPEFYVLYNGEDDFPAEKTLKLSDSFIQTDAVQGFPLELVVRVININISKQVNILEKCEPLKEYSLFVETVRKNLEQDSEHGFENAIKECLEHNILTDYLKRKTKEIMNMLVAEYSYETDIEVQREEAWGQGKQEGISQGAYQAKLETARMLKSLGDSFDKIQKATGLSLSEIEKL